VINANRLPKLIFIALVLGLFVLPVAAQDEGVTDDEVNEVAREIYCPVCESTPLDVCQTQACADWRALIRTKLAEGESEQEIFEYFARQYGDGVLANPPRRGVSLVVLWVLPVAVLLLGLLLFSRVLRGLRGEGAEVAGSDAADRSGRRAPSAPEPARDDYMARIEAELNKTDE
jgi:cytochrome c-type biogenesis protein CcmH